MVKLSIDTMIMNYLSKDLNLLEDDQAKLLYSLRVIIGDLSKLVILYIVFFTVNRSAEYLMALLALSIIRLYTGGLHFKTYTGCLLFTFLFFASSIYLASSNLVSQSGLIVIELTSLFFIALFSPITSKNRPDYSAKKRLQFKIIGCIAVILHLIGFVATKNNPYFMISIWVIFLQSIQLMIAKGVENREKEIQL